MQKRLCISIVRLLGGIKIRFFFKFKVEVKADENFHLGLKVMFCDSVLLKKVMCLEKLPRGTPAHSFYNLYVCFSESMQRI